MTPKPLHLVRTLRAARAAPREASRVEAAGPMMPSWLHVVVPLAILGMWAVAIDGIRLHDMTDLGLVSVMPVSVLFLLALLTASFCLLLRDQSVRWWIALVHLLVLIVMLYGITAFIEPYPRFSSVYRHVGIIDNLIRNGAADPSIDAYFNWPGFFALGAVMTQALGLGSPLDMAAWGSLVFNLLFVAPLLVIFRWATDDSRVWWLGLWVFFSTNWVGQDYLSPQAISFTLWLAMLAALLTWFTPRPDVLAQRLSIGYVLGLLDPRRIRPRLQADARHRARSSRIAAGIVLTVIVMFAAIVSGHQLTPFAIVLTVGALVVFAGLQTPRLPIIMLVLLAAWISYQATTFLVGHIDDLAKPLGSTSENLGANVTRRIQGSSEHTFIVQIRVWGSVLIWMLAIAGFARRVATRRFDFAFVLIGSAPLVLPILQPYGGEMLLRVFLFTLPVVAFFIACLAFPTPRHGRGRLPIVATALVCCSLLGLFQFTRYGNERMDHFTRGDVAAVDALYRAAPTGTTLFGGNLPWRARAYAEYHYRSILDLSAWRTAERPVPEALLAAIASSAPAGGAYVIVTRSMKMEAEMLSNDRTALDGLVEVLRASPLARLLYRGSGGHVFHVAHAPADPERRSAPPDARASRPAARPRRAARPSPPRARRRAPRPASTAPAPVPPPVAPAIEPQPQPVAPPPPPPPPPPPVRPAPPPPPAPPARPAPNPGVTFDDSG